MVHTTKNQAVQSKQPQRMQQLIPPESSSDTPPHRYRSPIVYAIVYAIVYDIVDTQYYAPSPHLSIAKQ